MITYAQSRLLALGAGLAAMAMLMAAAPALANHNLVTVSVSMVTADTIEGSISIRNTTPNAQTGMLRLAIFELRARPAGETPRLKIEDLRIDFGEILLPAGAGETIRIPFTVNVKKLGLKGDVLLAADFQSAIAGVTVPHTHSGTLTVMIPERMD